MKKYGLSMQNFNAAIVDCSYMFQLPNVTITRLNTTSVKGNYFT